MDFESQHVDTNLSSFAERIPNEKENGCVGDVFAQNAFMNNVQSE